MIIGNSEKELASLQQLKTQWPFAETNSLIQMEDENGKRWILRDKKLFRDSEEMQRVVSLHKTVLARFQLFTGVKLPETYLVYDKEVPKYLSEEIAGEGVLSKLKHLIEQTKFYKDENQLNAQKQLYQILNQIEVFLISLFDYNLNSHKYNLPGLVDMKLDQLVIGTDLQFYFVDFDPDFRKLSQLINFYGYLNNLENLLQHIVFEFLEVREILGDQNWGSAFLKHIQSMGYSIELIMKTPQLRTLLQQRLNQFENARDVFNEDRNYASWEI